MKQTRVKKLQEQENENVIGSNKMKDKKPPLGSGKRFKQLKEKIAKKGGVKDPAAVAAAIGRKKYGKKRFQELAAAGKKKKA